MKNRISLPELEHPINSNFKKESFTGGPPCVVAVVAIVTIALKPE